MAQFFLIYQGGDHTGSKEAQMENQQKWMAWMQDQGAALVEPQVIYKDKQVVSSAGVGDYTGTPTMGYSLLEAADKDAALAVAKACPFLEIGGEIIVAEKMAM